MTKGQALGEVVEGGDARRPERVEMAGRLVRVVPLDARVHGADLWEGVRGNDWLWTCMFDGPFADEASFRASLEGKAQASDPLFYAIVERSSGEAVGIASLMNIHEKNRSIEVGSIVYTPRLQRTPGATEAMYLMARYCFEELGYRRYEWKCNALNEPSRAAALRLGFRFEGVFRQHMVVKGRNRDTAWFAMVDGDWEERKQAFEDWLAVGNFDEGAAAAGEFAARVKTARTGRRHRH